MIVSLDRRRFHNLILLDGCHCCPDWCRLCILFNRGLRSNGGTLVAELGGKQRDLIALSKGRFRCALSLTGDNRYFDDVSRELLEARGCINGDRFDVKLGLLLLLNGFLEVGRLR